MKVITTTILLLITFNTYSSIYQVYGKLRDESSKQLPIEFATIAVKSFENDSIITSMITDSKGEFVFEVESGKYNLSIRCLGYKQTIETINILEQDLYLKPIGLVVEDNVLDEVSITASSYSEQFDKSIQTITKQFKEGTNNVNDLLSKIRGVDVDPINNSIKVNNEENILLLVNGVKKNQSYIKKMSPERVSRIEITRNPTGRFVSEGYASVINIILKKDYSGYDLYIEEKGLYSLDKSNGDEVLFNNHLSVDFTYTFKKINLYGSYSNLKSNTNLFVENTKFLDGNSLIKEAVSDAPNSERDGLSHNLLLGTDLFINSNQSISLEANVIHSPFDQNNTVRSYKNILNSDNYNETFASELNINKFKKEIYSLLSYRNKLSDKNKLELDYSYNKVESQLLNTYVEDIDEETEQQLYSKQNTLILDLNFEHLFNNIYSFEVGYKNTLRTYDYEYFSLSQNKEIETTKDIRNLLYAYVGYTPTSKFKTKIGIATEQNTLKTNNQSNKNNSLQPFLNIYYKHSKNLNIILKLNSDSEYPYAEQVNPYEMTIDRLSREVGNPNLNYSTEYISSLDFKLFKNKLSIEPFYSYTKNYISRTGNIINDHFQYTYSNLDKYESYGLKMSTSLALIPKKMFFSLTGSVYFDKTEFNGYINQLMDFNLNSNIMYLSSKYKTLYALMLKRINDRQIQAYGYFNNDNDYIGCLIKQPFFNRKLAVTFFYVLPVSSGLNYSMDDHFEYNMFEEETKTNVEVLKNLFMVKVSFNLNKGNEIKSIEKNNYKDKKQSKGFF